MPISGFAGCLLVLAGSLVAQTDWPIYGHDPGAMRYSPLKQINTKNVARIQLAWAFDTEAPITQAPGTQATAREPAGDSGGHAQPAAAAARPVLRQKQIRSEALLHQSLSRSSSVRPNGADHQWGKDPLK